MLIASIYRLAIFKLSLFRYFLNIDSIICQLPILLRERQNSVLENSTNSSQWHWVHIWALKLELQQIIKCLQLISIVSLLSLLGYCSYYIYVYISYVYVCMYTQTYMCMCIISLSSAHKWHQKVFYFLLLTTTYFSVCSLHWNLVAMKSLL